MLGALLQTIAMNDLMKDSGKNAGNNAGDHAGHNTGNIEISLWVDIRNDVACNPEQHRATQHVKIIGFYQQPKRNPEQPRA